MKERFPLFIQSDCYFEYRLAKLLSLWKPNLCIQKRYGSLFESTSSFSKPLSPSKLTNENITPALTCSEEDVPPKNESTRMSSLSGEGCRMNLHPACFASTRSVSCFPGEEGPCSLYCTSSSSPNHLNSEKTQRHQSPQQVVTPTKPPAIITEDKCLNYSNAQRSEYSGIPIENMAAELVKNVIGEVLTQLDRINTPGRSSQPGDQMNTGAYTDDESCQSEDCVHSAAMYRNTQGDEMDRDVQEEDKRGDEEIMEIGDKKMAEKTTTADQGHFLDSWYHGACLHGSRQGWDEFKEFLWGSPGERLLNLWMDIERLRTMRHSEKNNRHVVLMRSRYLLGGGSSSLSMELLSRLGLATTPCWTEGKLHLIQPCLTEALLSYWAPRFWTSQCILEDHGESSQLGLWAERHLRPPSGIDPHPRCITLPPLRPDTCLPRAAQTPSYFSSSPSPVFGSRRMERMLQALHVDSRAGLFFTQFCGGSGNQLWENAVNLWSDLQQYHHLFYQDGLDPYRVQRQAQILYSTYLCSSASRSVGADEETRREVYGRLTPAFEELFDEVEEQILVLLLEPWTQLISRDAEFYHRVTVQEEMRRVDSEEYRELQSLYAESELRLREVDRCKSTPPPSRPATPSEGQNNAWLNVSPRYHGYRLGSLLRHRHEIQHFRSFLQEHDASVHLSCWLDLDQYRRTPQKNKDVRLEKSSSITTKYLDRKYFFGPNSPASAEQQEHIMRLAGGPERLKHERLSNSVVVEIQDIVRRHIEKTWLPLFLATAEFTERQKLQAADKQSYGRSRRREAWKQAEGLWMSSSKEILLFRQVLLNPTTCHQFQRFVSLKGDFLENDVLFWLEVQRYKDLCHSHSDEATIQQKISTIISCFINSSVAPLLQIDIPPEQAQRIMHKRKELGPYIFREAQMSVFSELLKLWPQFQTLRSSVKEEQLLPLLEEQRVKHRARLQRRRTKEQQDEMETQETQVEGDDVEQEDTLTREQSRVIYSPTQQMSWSYSKYMAALKREEVLLKRQSQLEVVASFSTGSGRSSSGHSFMSAGSRRSQLRPCVLSPRTDKAQ